METNTEEIRETGNKHFPAVADIFKKMSDLATDAELTTKRNQSDLESSMNNLLSFIVYSLQESARYLDDCGETLVTMADEYDFVDGENAYNIDRPSSGFEDEEYNNADET